MANSKINELAINGGKPAVEGWPYKSRSHFGYDEKAACDRVLQGAIDAGDAPAYGGAEEDALCSEFAEMLGGGYADAVSSGTDSVFVALRSVGIEPFTEIICGPVTDAGGMMPIAMMNCIPVVADAEPGSFNISLDSIKARYTENTSAILVAHIAGEPADMEGIMAFAREKGLKVVEDCAQAHGATINGKLVGTFGDAAGYSLMYGKHTCVGGQGGIVFTKDEETYWRIRQNSDRGKPFGAEFFGYSDDVQNVVGTLNFNMDEMHAAIGRVQIKKMFDIAARRNKVVAKIMEGLKDVKCLSLSKLPEGAVPSYWFLRLLYDESCMTVDKYTFCEAVNKEGMGTNSYYQATPWHYDWYKNRAVFGNSGYPWAAPEYKGDKSKVYGEADLPNCMKSLNDTIIIFPNESWDKASIDACVSAFVKVYEAYKK